MIKLLPVMMMLDPNISVTDSDLIKITETKGIFSLFLYLPPSLTLYLSHSFLSFSSPIYFCSSLFHIFSLSLSVSLLSHTQSLSLFSLSFSPALPYFISLISLSLSPFFLPLSLPLSKHMYPGAHMFHTGTTAVGGRHSLLCVANKKRIIIYEFTKLKGVRAATKQYIVELKMIGHCNINTSKTLLLKTIIN